MKFDQRQSLEESAFTAKRSGTAHFFQSVRIIIAKRQLTSRLKVTENMGRSPGLSAVIR